MLRYNRSLNAVESEPQPEEDLSWMTFGLSPEEFEKKMMERYDSLAKCVLEDHFTIQVCTCMHALHTRAHTHSHTDTHTHTHR